MNRSNNDEDAPEEVRNSDFVPGNHDNVEDAHARKKRKRKKKKKKKRHRTDSVDTDESLSTLDNANNNHDDHRTEATDSEDEAEEKRPKKRQAVSPARSTTIATGKCSVTHKTNKTNTSSPAGAGETPNLQSPSLLRAPPESLLESDQQDEMPLPPASFTPVSKTNKNKKNKNQSPNSPTSLLNLPSPQTKNDNSNTTQEDTTVVTNNTTDRSTQHVYGEQPKELDPQFWTIQHVHTVLLALAWGYTGLVLIYAFLNPYSNNRTTTTAFGPNTCFRNNVRSPIKYQGHCADLDPTLFPKCPTNALCFAGKIHDCRFGGKSLELKNPQDYYELSGKKTHCLPTPQVTTAINSIVQTVELWTLTYACQEDILNQTSSTYKYPLPANIGASLPLFRLTDVTKQLIQPKTDINFTAPFDVSHPIDAHSFVSQFQKTTSSIQLANMPDLPTVTKTGWFGRTTEESIQEIVIEPKPRIPPGTPLLGLSKTPKEYFGRSLYLQCWWKGIPRKMIVSKPKKEPSVDRKLNLKVKPSNKEKKSKSSEKETTDTTIYPSKTIGKMFSYPRKIGMAVINLVNDTFFKKPKPKKTTAKKVTIDDSPKTSMDKKKDNSKISKQLKSSPKAPRMGKLGAVARKIKQALKVSSPKDTVSPNNSQAKVPSNYSASGAHYFYPALGFVGIFIILGLYYVQFQARRQRSWIPEIARVRGMALTKIQEATNGGWNLNHLKETVVSSEVDNGSPRRHLERNIWPEVEVQLRQDTRLRRTEAPSPSGRKQVLISWVSHHDESDPLRSGDNRHVFFHDSFEEEPKDSEVEEDKGKGETKKKRLYWEREGKRSGRRSDGTRLNY